MTELNYRSADQPVAPSQRGPMDGLWFTVLFASIAVGVGMTVFAPVGHPNLPPPPVIEPALPASAPVEESSPATVPAVTTAPAE